ncbi:MAG: type III-B CRISPR module RAMP protein Cmr1 [Deltaproteobacteria bacterium]|nr:type III-B CRISPR module RAMP protein Cmr1 [Deltaproteobacteria bacterium]
MTLAKGERVYQFKTLTDIWTGSITDRNGQIKEKPVSERLVSTGLLGSIRWWFEVLVRGMDGHACDPSPEDRQKNPSKSRCPDRDVKEVSDPKHHCVVCELFGCTGWARKFRFEVLDEKGGSANSSNFCLRFTPLRPIAPEEWALLDATLRLIADYGAIGGKTVFKPTDESHRMGETHHQDHGIVEVINVDPPTTKINLTDLEKYVRDERWKRSDSKATTPEFTWASLKNFWFVDGKTLSRESASKSTFNEVLGRKESKACRDCGVVHNPRNKCPITNRHPRRESEQLKNGRDEISRWLAGSQQESKKMFSFKNYARTFGFVKPGLIDFNVMKQRLTNVWGKSGWDFITGHMIVNQLFAMKEDRK